MPKGKNLGSFNHTKWAQEHHVNKSNRCNCCDEPYRKVIREVLEEMESGRAKGVSLEAIAQMLRKQFDFPYGSSSVSKHVRTHESEIWGRIRGGGIQT